MSIYTLPEYENLWRDKRLDVIKKNEATCTCSDLLLVLGVGKDRYNNCEYYTKTQSFAGFDQIIVCDTSGNPMIRRTNDSRIAIRPTIEGEVLEEVPTVSIKNGLLYIENGEYPQTVASELISLKLEKAYIYNEIQKTEKKYTMYYSNKYVKHFLEKVILQEYTLDGNKYVRVITRPENKTATLSSGITVKEGEAVWIKVEPITWIYDPIKKVGISEKALITGVPYNKKPYEPYYEDSFIEDYLNNTFSKEIIPNSQKPKEKKLI